MARPGNSDSFLLNFASLVGGGSFHFSGVLMLSLRDIPGPVMVSKLSVGMSPSLDFSWEM